MNTIAGNMQHDGKTEMLKWENMKDRLRIRVINAGKAIRDAKYKHTLKRVHPGGLMQIVTVDMGDTDSDNRKCVMQMLGTDILPSYYGFDPGVLFHASVKNSARIDPPVLRRLNASVASFLTGVLPDNLLDDGSGAGEDNYFDGDTTAADNAYVLTTASGTYGASVLAYEYRCGSILDRVADVIGEDYYVIPSSIHELILMPVSSCSHSTAKMQEMIRTINQTVVQQDDVLSNYLYRYNVEDKTFEIVI